MSGTVCRTALACLTVGHMSVFPAARNGRPPAYQPPALDWGSLTCRERLPPWCVVMTRLRDAVPLSVAVLPLSLSVSR